MQKQNVMGDRVSGGAGEEIFVTSPVSSYILMRGEVSQATAAATLMKKRNI